MAQTSRSGTADFEELRHLIFENAFDQAIIEYESWEKYKREQWKSKLYYGEEDLLDLTLSLLSSARRVRYPIAALDLAAYTIKKFGLDGLLANIPIIGMTFNTRTKENDPVQHLSLRVRSGQTSVWSLHYGAHILARCDLLSEDPASYLAQLARKITPPHDIVTATERELRRVRSRQCPYENEAEGYRKRNLAPEEVKEFFYKERAPSSKLKKSIDAEVQIEKDIFGL